MQPTRADFEELLQVREHELLERFGIQLTGGEPRPLRDGEAEESRRRAENWLQRNHPALVEGLCGAPAIQAARGDGFLEFTAVVDFLTTEFLNLPAALTIAAIIVKRGITWLCGPLGDNPVSRAGSDGGSHSTEG